MLREGEYRLTTMAAEALREAAESYVVGVLEDAYQLSIHAKRVTLFPRDIQLVIQLRRDLVSLAVG
jgi:histone H3/H4